MEREVKIGTIEWFDRVRKRGVISVRNEPQRSEKPTDVYFEVDPTLALQLHEGQLVQFIMVERNSRLEAVEIAVLSQKA